MPLQGINKTACENLVLFDNDHHILNGTSECVIVIETQRSKSSRWKNEPILLLMPYLHGSAPFFQ